MLLLLTAQPIKLGFIFYIVVMEKLAMFLYYFVLCWCGLLCISWQVDRIKKYWTRHNSHRRQAHDGRD
ncbi:hypothetical protein D770_20300 [Flammeovirgaceae bacterium 311]|nr:hypothetical protein D770_20300 [Flammeovirgaceae bacterium 311]